MAYTTYSTSRSANAMIGAQDYFTQMVSAFTGWQQARRTRAALNALSEHELADIGLARGDIDAVVAKGSL